MGLEHRTSRDGVAFRAEGIEHRSPVDHVIAMKDACGVDVVPHGEMRRFVCTRLLTENVEAIQRCGTNVPMSLHSERGDVEWSNPVAVTGRLRLRGPVGHRRVRSTPRSEPRRYESLGPPRERMLTDGVATTRRDVDGRG